MFLKTLKRKSREIIARRLYSAVDFFYSKKIQFLKLDRPPIVVLTPGKVGSSSIYNTLKKQLSNDIFHIYHIKGESIEDARQNHLSSGRKSIPLHLIVSKYLNKRLAAYKGKIYIITVVREPISREVSSFFQNADFHNYQLNQKDITSAVENSLVRLNEIFEENICMRLDVWFQSELKDNFGIDVFQEKFHNKQGYKIIKNGRFNLLLLKMEDMETVFPNAIQDFLENKKKIKMKNSNVSSDKEYGEIYGKVRTRLGINSIVMDKIITSNYFNYFYTDKREEVKTKWLKK